MAVVKVSTSNTSPIAKSLRRDSMDPEDCALWSTRASENSPQAGLSVDSAVDFSLPITLWLHVSKQTPTLDRARLVIAVSLR